MHSRWFSIPFLILAVAGLRVESAAVEPVPTAEPATEPITIVASAKTAEVRDYKVAFQLKSAEGADLASMAFKIRQTFGARQGENLLAMEVSLLDGQIVTQGQTLQITPSIYPKLTVLLDSHFRITDILGTSSSRFSQGAPGINYGNLPILFFPAGSDTPRTIGDSWQGNVKLPALGQEFQIVNTLKGLEALDGVEAAKLAQQITSAPIRTGLVDSHMKCTAESYFAVDNGRLLKSHTECEVDLPPDDTAPPAEKSTAAVRTKAIIDLTLAK
jgi:hypothetical protein